MLGLYYFPLEEISSYLQTFSWIQKRHFQRHCCYCLWNVKVSCKTLRHFSNIFFKLSTRNTAEVLVLLSQIHLSDSMENGSIRNKRSPSSLDIQQTPKIKWAIMCPSVPRDFWVDLAIKHWYIWKFLPGSIWLYLNESKHLSLWLKVSNMQPDYSASLVGMNMSKNPSLDWVCVIHVQRARTSVLSAFTEALIPGNAATGVNTPGATKSIWCSLLKQSRPCSHPPADR